MPPQRGLNTIFDWLEWYKLVLRTRLTTPPVLYLILKAFLLSTWLLVPPESVVFL